jgi:hypothetical protein
MRRERTFSVKSRHRAHGVVSDSDVALVGQGPSLGPGRCVGSGAATTASCAHISFEGEVFGA